MAADGARSSTSADSYIGSLISLTSKSEMRYEGILYNINTEESSIGLRNVRSFGTEGRKKDGPQVPSSDKVYEFILFRGSDIKDLQVKSSPPAQTSTPINSDPAIIQSHYPRPASVSSSLPSTVTGSPADPSAHTAQLGHPGSSFQGGLPLYQPGGSLGLWGPSHPPPSANVNGLPMPMYWQGFYGPPNGLPQLHQQSLLRPPPGLPMPPSMQQPMQYPGFNMAPPSGTSNLPGSNLPDYPSSLAPATTSSLTLGSASLPASTLPPTLPLAPPVTLASESLPNPITDKASNPTLSASIPSANLPTLAPLAISSRDANVIVPPTSNRPSAISGPSLLHQSIPQSFSSIVGPSNSSHAEILPPVLVTPGQLLQTGTAAVSTSQSSQTTHKDVEVVQVLSSAAEASTPVAVTEAQPPILPLPEGPQPSHAGQKVSGAFQGRHSYRGRERGRGAGSLRPVTKFTEDFDFMAMNEKFNKDEVWGHLGKSSKSHLKEIEWDERGSQDENRAELDKSDVKPLYNKDDFFDSISCNALDHESNHGRVRFSEQRKIDTETFGEFSRYRGGRGWRGPGRGGRFGGTYHARGYGHVGRGRASGRGISGWAS